MRIIVQKFHFYIKKDSRPLSKKFIRCFCSKDETLIVKYEYERKVNLFRTGNEAKSL